MLTCYGRVSNRLCTTLALAARSLCTEEGDGRHLSAFTAARLIPLDKSPGVRPIAVGEVFRRIIGKAVARVVERDVLDSTAPLQLCVGVPSACEAAIHAMDSLFRGTDVEAILLVDASNAFNALNRKAAMHNIPVVCPALGRVFENTYRQPCRLFVAGGGEIASQEGTCQGDPLAMAAYAVAVMPLIKRLSDGCPEVTQAWFADDDSAAGRVEQLRRYWGNVLRTGPGYGYHPNPAKTVLLVKPEHFDRAQQLFGGTGVQIRTDGCRYLGGTLGSVDFRRCFLEAAIGKWEQELSRLCTLAATQPHAAYTTLVKGILSKWRFTLRALECPPELFAVLDTVLSDRLLPILSGQPGISRELRSFLALPARFGGINIPVVADEAAAEHAASRFVTLPFVNIIVPPPVVGDSQSPTVAEDGRSLPAAEVNPSHSLAEDSQSPAIAEDIQANQDQFSNTNQPGSLASTSQIVLSGEPVSLSRDSVASPVVVAVTDCRARAGSVRRAKQASHRSALDGLQTSLTSAQQFLADVAGEKGVSSWLTAMPVLHHGTVLRKTDFRDALCIRYDLPLLDVATACVCGSAMSVHHAMTCPCGGYSTARHNEVRDLLAAVVGEVFPNVEVEPQLLPLEGECLVGRTANRAPDARLDIRARGFWTRQQDAYFDVRVTHLKASVLSRSEASSQLHSHELQKKRQYAERVNVVDRGVFTPLVFSTCGMAARECSFFLKNLAGVISEKNVDVPYSVVMNHLRCKLSFCLLRWAITCLRGCRASYRRARASSFLSECRLLK